jgi:hypothetical protein
MNLLITIIAGVYLRLGSRARYWERAYVPARLECGLRRLVYLQIPQLQPWRNRGVIYSRKVE